MVFVKGMKKIKTFHLIGSKTMGGAEKWFFRFTKELSKREDIIVERGIRKNSELCRVKDGVVTYEIFFKTVWDPISKIQIKRLIKKNRPHIVQTYMGRATRLTHLSKEEGVIHVSRIGGYYKLHCFRHAHAWIGNTKGICDYLISSGFPKNRVFLIYNFVEIPNVCYSKEKIEEEKKRFGIDSDDLILLCLGRFVPVKGHSDLIKAIYILKEKIKRPIKLIFLGEGPLKEELMSLAYSLGVESNIIWAGWQDDPGLFYTMCDVVVFPSLEKETFGNVILEAWAYERPIVCTNFLGAQEIGEDEVNMLKAPCRDPVSLAEKIKMVIEDQELRDFIVQNGKQKVIRDFSKEKIISQYIELYKELIGWL